MKCLQSLKSSNIKKLAMSKLTQSQYMNISKKYFQDFKLSDNFVEKYKNRPANFGFNGLGELVYRRTYSRTKKDGSNEEWYETVRRVVEGTFSLLQ